MSTGTSTIFKSSDISQLAYNILEKAQNTNNPRVSFINNPNTLFKRPEDSNRATNTASSIDSRKKQYTAKKELQDQLRYIVDEYSPPQ
jgi:hypothetical protein